MATEKPRSEKSKLDKIDRTEVTIQQVEDAMVQYLETDARFDDWEYVEIGKETFSKMLEVIADNLMTLHNNELKAYDMFYKKVPRSEWPMPLAEFYGSKVVTNNENPDGFLILEDLSDVAACADMGEGYNYEQAKALTCGLAKLHAWSLKNQELWMDAGFEKEIEKMMEPMFDSLIKGFDGFKMWATEKHPNFFGNDVLSKLDCLKPDLKLIAKFANLHKDHNLPDVLVHGDFWSNNLLMCKDADTSLPTDEIRAVIDWQIIHPGGPAEDISRLFLMSCNAKMRDAHEDELLKYYHDQLGEHLAGEPPFSFNELKQFYEQMYMAFAGMFAPFSVQMEAMVDSGHFIKTKDPAAFKAKMLDDTKSTITKAIKLKEAFGSEV